MKKGVTETERSREQSFERINAFSDGIFAIIITILSNHPPTFAMAMKNLRPDAPVS